MVGRIVIVSEPHHVKAIKKMPAENAIVIATSKSLEIMLRDSGIATKTMNFSENMQEELIWWMKQLPYVLKENGADILKNLSYDGLSYWWLMENWLFRGDSHFDSISDVLCAIEAVDSAVKAYCPEEIAFGDDGKLFSNVIKHICKIRNIAAVTISKNRFLPLKKTAVDFISSQFWWWSFRIRKFYSKNAVRNKIGVLFIRGVPWERVYDFKTKKMLLREPFTDSLRQKFKDSISVGIQVGSNLNIKCMNGSSLLEGYYDKKAGAMRKEIVSNVMSGFNSLLKNKNFRKSFVFCSYNIWPLVEKQFHRYFKIRFGNHARSHAMICRMLDMEKPSVVVSPEEVSEFARLLFFSCIKNKIPVIALQHGIFDKNLLCFHKKNEVSSEKISPYLCPIPAKTCVFGPYYKDMLIKKGCYPSDSVAVMGVQRFDRIFSQGFSKESFHQRHSIPANKRIISYITSPTPFNEEMTIALLKEAKKIPESIVVIKIHPSEKTKFYRKIINDAESDAILLDSSDLYDVLNASDVVVTYLSTAGLEAMLFKKPLAVLNLTGEEDRISYAKAGAAAGIYDKDDIAAKISALLSKGSLYEKIQRNASLFIKKNVFKPDGRATERIAKIIEKFT